MAEPGAFKRRPIPVAHYRGYSHTHTDARSAKKDVISTKPQKAMGAVRYSPEKDKEKHKPNLLPRFPPPNVAVLGACYPV